MRDRGANASSSALLTATTSVFARISLQTRCQWLLALLAHAGHVIAPTADSPHRAAVFGESSLITILYCFYQNNDHSKCEVDHPFLRFAPLKVEPGGETWHRNQNQNQLGSYLPSRWR